MQMFYLEKHKELILIKIFSDLHITKESISECRAIVREIIESEPQPNDELWFLGDTFHAKNARDKKLTAEELKCFVGILRDCNEHFNTVIWLDGNHDQITENLSLISFSKMLFPNVNVVGRTFDVVRNNKKIYLGHHMTEQSGEFVSDLNYKVKDLDKEYDLWLLGDNHKHMKLGKNGWHVGSARRVSFNEVDYGQPVFGILDLQTLKIDWKPLQSAIPMKRVESMAELKKVAQNGSQAQIQLVFKDFQTFIKNVDKLPDYEKKFHRFSIKHDYTKTYSKKTTKKKTQTFDEVFDKYLKTVKNERVRELILEVKNA